MSAISIPTVTTSYRAVNWKLALAVALVIAAISGMISPLGPLGDFWRPPAHMLMVNEVQMPFLILLGMTEAFCFGLGTSFLIFGYPMLKAIKPVSINLIRITHFAITWLLGNWWLHDSLHLHFGMSDMTMLLIVDYSFHMTLMLAAAIVVYFFLTLMEVKIPTRWRK